MKNRAGRFFLLIEEMIVCAAFIMAESRGALIGLSAGLGIAAGYCFGL